MTIYFCELFYATYITFQPQTTNWRYLQTGDRRNARFLVGDDSEEEEEDEKKDYFSDPESEESEDKSKWVKALQNMQQVDQICQPRKKSQNPHFHIL